jgi:tetratricopeptide (TPR) repeat protein
VKAARNDTPAAIDLYRRSVAVVPTHDALVALGDLYRLTGQREAAASQYALVETIYRLQKANGVRGDAQIARFYADHDRNIPEALRLAESEYATRKNVVATDTLAWCLYKSGRYAEARDMIERALAHSTPDAGFRFHAGMIYAKLGDRVTAQNRLYQALSLNPAFSPVDAPMAAAALAQLGSRAPTVSVARN